ncbi:DUF4189 domain-containing protein [Stenotrophomonas rhizophila]
MRSVRFSGAALLLVGAIQAPAGAQQPGSVEYNTVYLPGHGAGDVVATSALDRWGAIATGKGDALGFVVGARSEKEARANAIKECSSGGAENCEVEDVFINVCIAVASSPSANYWSSGSPNRNTAKALRERALKGCGEKDCRIIREGCAYEF